jgi:ribosomal-protein-alanine N-acetyltransferase
VQLLAGRARPLSERDALGYSVDQAHEGQGIMREALEAALDEVFSERCLLHRVQANVRPENCRSIALLERLRFEREGRSRNYLFIDGAWRDHLNYARLNPNEQQPP